MIVAVRNPGWRRAVLLAVAVGVLFGVVAMLTKLVMHLLTHDGVRAVLTTPVPYLLVVLGIVAVLLQQSAFHAGSLQTSVPTMLVLEPVVAVVLGAVVLGEHMTVNGAQGGGDRRRARRDGRGDHRPGSRRGCTGEPNSRPLWRREIGRPRRA